MRYLMVLILVAAVAFATDPRGKNENNALYIWAGIDFDVYQSDVGIAAYRNVAEGADTAYVYVELDTDDYTHGELYIEFTADAATGNYAAVKSARNVAIYWVPSMLYSARSDSTIIGNMNNEDYLTGVAADSLGFIYTTITSDSTSLTNKTLIGNLSGRLGQSTGVMGPFWIDATTLTDTTGAGFAIITADTVGISWRALLIPRT